MSSPSPASTVSVREKLFYGSGDLASCLFWNSFQWNLLLYYTDVFGITFEQASVIFLVSRIWDAVNDPLVGAISDRTKTRWGRYRPFLLWFSLPLCVAGVLMFTTPDFGPSGKLIWAWVTYNAVMMLYTLVNIPYTALLGTISADSHERASVSTFKFGGAFTACVIVSFTFMPLTRNLADGDPTQGWQRAFMVMAGLALVFFLICFSGTRERVTPTPGQKTNFRQDLRDLMKNRPWMVLVALTIAWVFFNAARSTVMNHYLKYFVIGQAETTTVSLPFLGTRMWDFADLNRWFNTTGQFASLLGVVLIGLYVKRIEKKWNFLLWFVVANAFTAATFWLRSDQVGLLLFTNIMGSLAGGPMCVLIWAMYSDTAEYSEWKNNRQASGLIFSASTFAQKLGWGIGPAAVSWTLGLVGFIEDDPKTPEIPVQGPDVLWWLVLMVSLIPAAFGVVSMACMYFYPLTDKRVHEMSAELKTRRRDDNGAPVTI